MYQLKVEMIFVAKVHFMIEEEENLGYHIGSTVYIRTVSLLSALLHWFIGCLQSQGRHGWTGLQGGLVWILQNRKRGRQQRHAADVVAAVGALPAKNWRWLRAICTVHKILRNLHLTFDYST